MKNGKKLFAASLLAAAAILGLWWVNRDKMAAQGPSSYYEPPLTYSSFEEFHNSVGSLATPNSAAQEDSRLEKFHVDELTFYYKPCWLPQDAELDSIRLTDRYVALYYGTAPAVEETGEEERTSTVMFEWTRLAEGEALLRDQAERLGSEESGYSGVLHDVIRAENDRTELGRQYYWVRDGYFFTMYIPTGKPTHGLTFDVERVSLA